MTEILLCLGAGISVFAIVAVVDALMESTSKNAARAAIKALEEDDD